MEIKVHSKLNTYLENRGIKKGWLAHKVGVNRSTITRWCTNKNDGTVTSTPTLGYTIKLIRVLECSVHDIFEEI